jgi:hypothetical protein
VGLTSMPRESRPAVVTRSELWLRVLINSRPSLLSKRLSDELGWQQREISWFSPLARDEHAEYRDESFLQLLGIDPPHVRLRDFWPLNGPRWDGLGRLTVEDNHRFLLIEAKAHIEEANTTPCGATPVSFAKISRSLNRLKAFLRSSSPHDWSTLYYQYTNRLAHLYFLRALNGIDAYLIFVYFVNAPDVPRPATEGEWRGANRLLKSTLGLGRRHPLSDYTADVFVDVNDIR